MNRFILTLIVSCLWSFTVALGVDVENRFREEYPPAVKRLQEAGFNQSTQFDESFLDGSASTLNRHVVFKGNGENKLVTYWYEKELQELGEQAKKTLVYGPTKMFRISEDGKGAFKAISARPTGEMDPVLVSVAGIIFLPFSPLDGQTLIEAEQHETIKIDSITAKGSLISVKWHRTNESFATETTTLLDPEQGWAAVSHTSKDASGATVRSSELEYSSAAKGVLPSLTRVKQLRGGKEYVAIVSPVTSSPATADEFKLSWYGLPETLGDAPGRSWRPLGISGVLLCVAAWVVWRIQSQRRNC